MTGASEARTELRELLATMPGAVTIVTARQPNGQPAGLTVTAFSAVTLDPPLVLVCLETASRTLAAMQRTGTFTVNVLAGGAHQTAQRFATHTRDTFDDEIWQPAPQAGYGPVLAAHTCGDLLCSLAREIHAGDHSLVLGHVEQTQLGPEADPLVYGHRTFTTWRHLATEPGTMPAE